MRFELKGIVQEFWRRKVVNTIGLYVIGAWGALQIAELALPALDIPEGAIRYVWAGAFALFPLVLIFGWFYNLSSAGVTRSIHGTREGVSLHATDRFAICGLAITALAIVAGLGVRIVRYEIALPPAEENSIAVLPFDVCHEASGDRLLARSLASEVINRLASRDRLKVTARKSAFTVAGMGMTLSQMAKPLQVEYLLSGEFCRDNGVPNLTVELADAKGFTRWRETFEQRLNEFGQITQQLATAAADGVAVSLGEVVIGGNDPPVHRLAHEQLLLALEHRRAGNTEEARKALDRALEYEPEYPEALGTLASWTLADGNRTAESIREAQPIFEKALASAERAIALGNRDFRLYFTIGRILHAQTRLEEMLFWRDLPEGLTQEDIDDRKHVFEEGFLEAEPYLRKAVNLNPSDMDAAFWLWSNLRLQGPHRYPEVTEIMERALEREPFHLELAMTVATFWANRGRYRQAIELLRRFLQLPEIPAYAWSWQFMQMGERLSLDEECEAQIEMLLNDPDNARIGINQLPLHGLAARMAGLGRLYDRPALVAHADAWHERLATIEFTGWKARIQGSIVRHYLKNSGQKANAHAEHHAMYGAMSQEELMDQPPDEINDYAWTLFDEGERERALELVEAAHHAREDGPYLIHREMNNEMGMAVMYEMAGYREQAVETLERMLRYLEKEVEHGGRHPNTLAHLARVYAGLGRTEEAVEMLRLAVDYHWRAYALLDWEPWPFLDRIRDDPRFLAQVDRMRADLRLQADRIEALLAPFDVDELLAPALASES